jgi:hypothetical protein
MVSSLCLPVFLLLITYIFMDSLDWMRLPTLNTTLVLSGLNKPVEVYWDKYALSTHTQTHTHTLNVHLIFHCFE